MPDPLDVLRALGWRVILVPDFDGLVCLVTDESIVLIADAPAHTS